MAVFIMVIPWNSIPNPMMTDPTCLIKFCLINRYMTAPPKSSSGVKALRLNAVICAVIVVPILAPMITPIAWVSFIRPELTKPITMTSVADELCTSIVMPRPTRTATILFFVACSKITWRLSPQAFLSPEDIIVIPKRKRPTPPSNEKTSTIDICFFLRC